MVKAADVQVANGTAAADLPARLDGLKDQAPQLTPAIRKVEDAQEQVRHDQRWKAVQGEARSLAAIDDPQTAPGRHRRLPPRVPRDPHRAEALRLAQSLKTERDAKRFALDRQFVDDLVRSEVAAQCLSGRPDRARPSVPRRASRQPVAGGGPAPARRLPATAGRRRHRKGPRLLAPVPLPLRGPHRTLPGVSEGPPGRRTVHQRGDGGQGPHPPRVGHLRLPPGVRPPRSRIPTTWPRWPAGSASISASNPTATMPPTRSGYLDWWDKVSVPGQYRVTLRRGEVEPSVGKYLAGSGPDLGVTIEVAGAVYGPSSVIRDSYQPIWDYTYAQPITWKLGDPVTIRLIDYDWSASEVYTLHSRQGDPLAIRLLSGTIKPAKGGKTTLCLPPTSSCPSSASRNETLRRLVAMLSPAGPEVREDGDQRREDKWIGLDRSHRGGSDS